MLSVWLPLNGKLENLGLGTITSDVDSEPLYKDYGKLLPQSFDLSQRVYFNCEGLKNIQTWTVAFWARVEDGEIATTSWQDLWGFTDVRTSDGITGNFRVETDAESMVRYNDNSTCAMASSTYTFNSSEIQNEWHHYAITVSDSYIRSYYDGNLVNTSTANGGSWNSDGRFYIGCTGVLNGCLQDLRIWDKSISSLEIQQISRGLALHLPLDHQANMIYDTSGYCRNGSIIGTLDYSSDSPRYSASTYFDGDTAGILLENLDIAGILNNQATISFWIKPDGENGYRSVYFSAYSAVSWSIEKTEENRLRSWWDGSPDEAYANTDISDDVWSLITIVKNGTNDMRFYINGERVAQSTAEYADKAFATTWRIGRDTRTGTTSYKGLMSDFRIYATCLLPQDIRNLYAVAASVADNGTLMMSEVSEL